MPILLRSPRAIGRAWVGAIAQAYDTTAVIALLLPAARVDLIRELHRRADQMGRSGWLTFSAVLLIIAGIMRVIDAIWAFGYDGAIPGNLQRAVDGPSAHHGEKPA